MMNDLLDLGGKDALVTGGARGVGRATARMLAKAGVRSVGIAYRSREADATAAADELRGLGAHAWQQAGDLTRLEDVEALFARSDEESGGLDVVVVNHGIWPPHDVPLERMSDEQWHRTLGANLHSVFYTCRAAAPRLRGGGPLVLVGSTAGQRGEALHPD
jgi:3-oxoacyl-[acyl-carrier protein] reductase